jgi:L-asparaginase
MSRPDPSPDRVVIVSTGGTIEKTYDPRAESLANAGSVLDHMLATLRLPDLEIERVALMDKDSLEMTADDHQAIATRARAEAARAEVDGVVVVHGTSRLAVSGEVAHASGGRPASPIVFTGAMRPYAVRDSDAMQNLTEAIFAARTLAPAVYVVLHGRSLSFPGPEKDDEALTFVRGPSGPPGLS